MEASNVIQYHLGCSAMCRFAFALSRAGPPPAVFTSAQAFTVATVGGGCAGRRQKKNYWVLPRYAAVPVDVDCRRHFLECR